MRRFLMATCLSASILLYAASPAWAVGPVTIPSNYVYDPALGSLHDYCTRSYDVLPVENRQLVKSQVDNRGACARHDLCYEGDESKRSCDTAFYHDLLRQCDYTFGGDTTGFLDICRTRSQTYYAAVHELGSD